MADGVGPIASAVILPDSEPAKSPSTKRRQSSASDHASKRPRLLSHDKDTESPPTTHELEQTTGDETRDTPSKPPVEKRKSSVQEERKRGQRLFGGLLSTLSQSTPTGQQRRREEIERRQKERAKQQKAEDDVRRAEKLANLKAIRKTEQIKFEEQAMRTRHSNMLALANFLCTKTEPKLYYKPWELLPRDEDRIKQQIEEVEAIIDREEEEFYTRHPEVPSKGPADINKTNGTSKETVGEPQAESPSISNANVDTTNNTPVQAHQSNTVKTENKALEEHNGEVVVENEEDTVIY